MGHADEELVNETLSDEQQATLVGEQEEAACPESYLALPPQR